VEPAVNRALAVCLTLSQTLGSSSGHTQTLRTSVLFVVRAGYELNTINVLSTITKSDGDED
jgi:hypothetical protein